MILKDVKIIDTTSKIKLLQNAINKNNVSINNIKFFVVASNDKVASELLHINKNSCKCYAEDCATCANCYLKNNNNIIIEVLK